MTAKRHTRAPGALSRFRAKRGARRDRRADRRARRSAHDVEGAARHAEAGMHKGGTSR